MIITLTTAERDVLLTTVRLPERLRNQIRSAVDLGEKWRMEMSENDANDVRDLCGDVLPEVGFDEKYTPTKTGKILEDLIDRFFTG